MFTKYFVPGPEKVHEVPEEELGPPPKTVLMLEDDQDLSEILKQLLESSGYKVHTAGNGVEGLKMIMASDYDVILCDMLMPHLPGDMFFTAVQRVKPELCKRFIFMTGHRADPRWDAFVRKVNGVMLWKPFQHYVLLEAIELILKKNQPVAVI